MSQAEFEHGLGGYTNHDCGCATCTAAWAEYQRAYRRENRERVNAQQRARRRVKRAAARGVALDYDEVLREEEGGS